MCWPQRPRCRDQKTSRIQILRHFDKIYATLYLQVPDRGFVKHADKEDALDHARARRKSLSHHSKGQGNKQVIEVLSAMFMSFPGQPMSIDDLVNAVHTGTSAIATTSVKVRKLVDEMHAIEVLSRPSRFVLTPDHKLMWESSVERKIVTVLEHRLMEPVLKSDIWTALKDDISKPVFDAALCRLCIYQLHDPSNTNAVQEKRGGFMLTRGIASRIEQVETEVHAVLEGITPVKYLKLQEIAHRINTANDFPPEVNDPPLGTIRESEVKEAVEELDAHNLVQHKPRHGYGDLAL